ncbi:cyclophilin-like fold protein [Brucella intermedia]|uniref:Cyclophilin-like domain-containing protein n=1 Tax=Brucella intermedia M86 TaxID=1234597 RepID=M5JV42_9HYPH|nr:cyclophilin-like fold protein [Brucella intermedia]ELT47451.1 hypothetical protein D584_19403 [Brucella intermedia M86]
MGTLCQILVAIVTTLTVAGSIPTSKVADQVVGTVVRFAVGETSVDVTIGQDNPTVRDLLSRLPLTMKLEEYVGREKIAYVSPKLETEGSPGSDPEDGDLIYFAPWGNIGFYYDTSGVGYSDQTIHIGKYKASLSDLEKLEGKSVRVELAR